MAEEIDIVTAEQMESLIYIIRGQKVMLDVDLAKIYGYETKNFNRQVKNNIEKFPSDFMFQLTKEESLRCKNFTLNEKGDMRGQHIKYLPYAFTEQGIYMLMTVLKGELATLQSLALVRLFKEMKDYISANVLISAEELLRLSIQNCENTTAIARIEKEMLKKSDLPNIIKAFSKEQPSEYLFMNGEMCEANVTYQKIYNKAKKSIFIIDNYISLDTLLMLKNIAPTVNVTIFSDNKGKDFCLSTYNQFTEEYPNINIKFINNNDIFHDRYIVLDYGTKSEKVYHCGASSKDAGKRITTISESKDTTIYKNMIDEILKHPILNLK